MSHTKFRLQKGSIWNSPITLAIQDLAYEGFTHKAIAMATTVSPSCVSYRLGRLGVSTQNVRSGLTTEAILRVQRVLAKHKLQGLGPMGKHLNRKRA